MSFDRALGRTIQLYLVDGTPSGLRKATIHGWTGIVLIGSETSFASLTSRVEMDRPGIYFLTGPNPESDGNPLMCIGSANSVRERIQQSAEKRAFWETAVAVVTSDDGLSKGHVEYLEARLIEMVISAGRVTLDNATSPPIERRRLPEADKANMEHFLANLQVVLPVVGLKQQPRSVKAPRAEEEMSPPKTTRFELRHRSGVSAEAVEEDGEFVVLEGSEALPNEIVESSPYHKLRKRLINDQVLCPGDNGRLRFTKPHLFSSPSAASAVILNRSSNGRLEWKEKATGKPYGDWKRQAADVLTELVL